jgi:hypothetical protein
MAKGQTRTFTRVVQAVKAGFGEIVVTAQNRVNRHRVDGGTDSVFATVGANGANGSFGLSPQAASAVGSVVATHGRISAPERLARRITRLPSPRRPATQVAVSPNTAGTSCVTGTWNYVDQNSVTRAANDVSVNVLRSGVIVASGYTSPSDGSYNVCWSTGGTSQDVSVQWVESNTVWTVVNLSNAQYKFATGVATIPDGTTHNFGALQPADPTVMRALHAYQEANDEYQWIYGFFPYIGGCWSPLETTCRPMVIHWQADSTTGTFWNSSGAYLLAGSPDTLDEPVHEYGHGLMYNLYGQTFPATTNCNPHFLFTASSTTCAWTEGWADWVATSVYNNTTWTFNGGSTVSLNVTWNEGLGYDVGDQVEGRIAEAMRSLTDGIKPPWDNDPGEGSGIRDNTRWFNTMQTFRPNTFAQEWGDRALDGYDVSQTALSALYQGTIDYGFRNPLTSTIGGHFPEAVPDHNYSATVPSGFWSLVAEKPDASTDTDLRVYSDTNLTSLVNSSAFGGTTTDFVALNANSGHLVAGTDYPQVHQFAGTGGYSVEFVGGSGVLTAGSTTVAMGSSKFVQIRDSFQNSGTPVYLRAVPDAAVDVQFAVASADKNSVSRSQTTSSPDLGPGGQPRLVYTPTATGWHALILLDNNLAAGNVTLYADTTAPTGGSVAINGGATVTTNPNVTLTLAAADTETGVMAMQISTDGVFDTEPIVPFSTSASATLSGSFGTKTVIARFLNHAAMWSAAVRATITYQQPKPTISSVSPTAGPVGGSTNVTITGTDFSGATKVTFGGNAATSFTVVSPTSITAVTPAHAAGVTNIFVTTPGGTSAAVAGDQFTFVAKPTISSVSPTAGPIGGGTTVTITGTAFSGATKVTFAGKAATRFTVVSPTRITAVTPAHAAGLTNIFVTTPGGTSTAVAGDQFTFR